MRNASPGHAILGAMSADDLSLLDDMDLLKAMVRAMAQKTAALEDENAALKARSSDADERIKRLMQILKAYDRARFGRRSEKLGAGGPSENDEAQQAFVFEEIETGISALRAQVSKGRTSSDEKRPPRARKGFPLHLERVEVVIEPEDRPLPTCALRAAIPVSISSKTKACCASSSALASLAPSFSERRPNRARS